MPGPRPAYGWTERGKGNVAMTVLWTGMAACALVFFLAMIPAYYLAAEWMDGVWGMSYVYGWTMVACLSPFAAWLAWYAFGRGWLPNVLSVLVVAAALLADPVVLRSLNLRDFVLAGVCAVLVFGWKAPRRDGKG